MGPDLASLDGQIFCSRSGVIAKMKHGRRKIRLVHDLRRFGVNSCIKVRERVALPRLTDVVNNAHDLMAKIGASAVSAAERAKNMWIVVMFWRALGFTLSWKKGAQGPEVE